MKYEPPFQNLHSHQFFNYFKLGYFVKDKKEV